MCGFWRGYLSEIGGYFTYLRASMCSRRRFYEVIKAPSRIIYFLLRPRSWWRRRGKAKASTCRRGIDRGISMLIHDCQRLRLSKLFIATHPDHDAYGRLLSRNRFLYMPLQIWRVVVARVVRAAMTDVVTLLVP